MCTPDDEVLYLVNEVIKNTNSEGEYPCGSYDQVWGNEQDEEDIDTTDDDGSDLRN